MCIEDTAMKHLCLNVASKAGFRYQALRSLRTSRACSYLRQAKHAPATTYSVGVRY